MQFLDVVDSSIMNVALPSIRRDLRATNSRGEPVIHPADGTHAAREQVPVPEPAD